MATMKPRPKIDPLVRFMSHVEILPDFGCWLWTGAKTKRGYGRFQFEGKAVLAHRWIYQQMIGPLLPDEEVGHNCFNTWCVNFGRCLTPETRLENNESSLCPSALNKQKNECDWGHEFTEANTYFYTTKRGLLKRGCRECRHDAVRRYRAHGREAA